MEDYDRDQQSLETLDRVLRNRGGRHLVVGHRKTLPTSVELLGGKPGPKINENEYDRIYVVWIGSDDITHSVMLRYGIPYKPK